MKEKGILGRKGGRRVMTRGERKGGEGLAIGGDKREKEGRKGKG